MTRARVTPPTRRSGDAAGRAADAGYPGGAGQAGAGLRGARLSRRAAGAWRAPSGARRRVAPAAGALARPMPESAAASGGAGAAALEAAPQQLRGARRRPACGRRRGAGRGPRPGARALRHQPRRRAGGACNQRAPGRRVYVQGALPPAWAGLGRSPAFSRGGVLVCWWGADITQTGGNLKNPHAPNCMPLLDGAAARLHTPRPAPRPAAAFEPPE